MAAVVHALDAGLFEDLNLELDLGRAYAASIFDSVPESPFGVKRLFKFHMGTSPMKASVWNYGMNSFAHLDILNDRS